VKRISHSTIATIIGVVYLALITNLLLIAACLPFIVLLVTTDPMLSWPLLAITAPFCAPGLTAAFTAFRENSAGGLSPVRAFVAGWRATWRRSLALGLIVTGVAVVLLVDVRFFSDSPLSVVVVPALGVLTALTASVALVGLVAISEAPKARLLDVVKAAAYLALRRWYFTAVSIAVLAIQAALFASIPAIALGITAAPALYLAWANSRFTLRPVLDTDEVAAA